MKFVPLEIEGVLGIIETSHTDFRGSLTRVWDSNSILKNFNLSQSSFVMNPIQGTLRGLHYQSDPFSENKVIECLSGKVFDVIVDVRKDSSTYGRHLAIELGPSAEYIGLYVPSGFAHGYLTLEPDTILIYFMDKEYSQAHAQGVFWGDSSLSINWPMQPVICSDKDTNWPKMERL